MAVIIGSGSPPLTFQAAEAALPADGGEILVPAGTWVTTGWAPTKSNIVLRGEGRFATTIKGSGSGTHVLKLNDVARWHVKDLTIDADDVKDATVILGDAGHSGSHLFEAVYLLGATVDTLRLGTSASQPGYDVADNVFLRCSIDSWGPSNSQILIEGNNTTQNTFAFGAIGLNAGIGGMTAPAVNVKVQDGGNLFLNMDWAGSTSFDIEAAAGQVIVIGGHSESPGGFFHSLSSNYNSPPHPALYPYAPHAIRDFRAVHGGAATGLAIHHEAQRTLILDNVMSSKSIRVGEMGRLVTKNVTFFRGDTSAPQYVFDAALPQFTDRPFAKVYLGSSVSVSPGTWHTLSWDTVAYDHFSTHSGSRLTVPVQQDGWYDVDAQIDFAPNSAGDRAARLKVNGTSYPGGSFHLGANGSGGSGANTKSSFRDTVFLKGGDYLEVEVLQTTSGWLSITGGYPSNSWFGMRRHA